jgi:photosystem II stability/assembly factor-like uncharacterized protein
LRQVLAAAASTLPLLLVGSPTRTHPALGHPTKTTPARLVAGELHQVPPILSDVDFASPTTSWVTANEEESGQILGTTDSGRSWRSGD